jgi:PRTRC genetic system protein E
MTLFNDFAQMLGHDEEIVFTVKRHGNDLTVLVQPKLGQPPAGAMPENIQQLRAALAMPLHITAPAIVLDAKFPWSLTEYADLRAGLLSDLEDTLAKLREAGRQAKALPKSGGTAALPRPHGPSVEEEADSGVVVLEGNSLF